MVRAMTSSPDNTVGIVLDDAFDMGVKDLSIDYLTLRKNMIKKIDSHYLSIFLELVGEPEKGMESKITKTPNGLVIDEWGDIASGFRNALRQELRTALQDRLGEK